STPPWCSPTRYAAAARGVSRCLALRLETSAVAAPARGLAEAADDPARTGVRNDSGRSAVMGGEEVPEGGGGVQRGGGVVETGDRAGQPGWGGAGPLVPGSGDGDKGDAPAGFAPGVGSGDRAGDPGRRGGAVLAGAPGGQQVRDGRAVDLRDAVPGT